MDYQWLLDAAGNNEQRLAQLSLLFAGAAMATSASMSREKALPMILEIRAAMDEIAVRMDIDTSQIIKNVWGTTGQG